MEVEAWEITGPKIVVSFDPLTGEEVRFAALTAEATVAGRVYAAMLSCPLGWVEDPESIPTGALDSLIRLAKMATLDRVGGS